MLAYESELKHGLDLTLWADHSISCLFQKSDSRFSKKCPLSGKDAPVIDYKNIKLLKRYVSDTDKIMPTRITSVSQNKQRKLSGEIKKAKILGFI